MAEQPKIEIYNSGPDVHGWTIRVGDRYQDHLTYGEMLELFIGLTVNGRIDLDTKLRYGGLKTAEEWAEQHRSYSRVPDEVAPIDEEFPMPATGEPKQCPNCGSTMNAGESCPECEHTELTNRDCDCRECCIEREEAN